jgi:hypothetical protein
VDAGAAPRRRNQVSAPVCRYSFDDLRLRRPGEWIVYVKGTTENRRKQATKSSQDLWMRGARRSGANDLGDGWQIHTHHAVLEYADAVSLEQSRSHHSQCGKEKGPRPVRRLLAEPAI